MISGEDFGCKSLPNATKRKQDFLFFSLPCLLVSDDDSGNSSANHGVSLPEGYNATYDAALSSLFLGRNGRGSLYESELSASWRGLNGYFLSSSPQNENNAKYFKTTTFAITPSDIGNRIVAQSLRCLVSTNNG